MIFSQGIIGNSRAGADQWAEVRRARIASNRHERFLAQSQGLAANVGLIPEDVYQEFDNITVERFRSDDGDAFLNDLMPLSSPVSIGKLVHRFRQASDAGLAQTSMTGQIGVKLDQVEYTYDGTLIPIIDVGYTRNWREWNAMTSEGFDGLIDDQRESVATLRRHLADNFLDGNRDTDGNVIIVDGLQWQGMRNDSRVASVDLGAGGINFDFTDTTKTFIQIEAAFKQVRDILWITNKCEQDATYYMSREIVSNFERNSSESFDSKKIIERLSSLMGVATVKSSSKLSGNEMMAFPLDSNRIKPIVGMGINTVAMPRPVYNSNYQFTVWGAMGFEVRNDFAGNTCALYATG